MDCPRREFIIEIDEMRVELLVKKKKKKKKKRKRKRKIKRKR